MIFTFSIFPCASSLSTSPTIPHIGKSSKNSSYQYCAHCTTQKFRDKKTIIQLIIMYLLIYSEFKRFHRSLIEGHIAYVFIHNICYNTTGLLKTWPKVE